MSKYSSFWFDDRKSAVDDFLATINLDDDVEVVKPKPKKDMIDKYVQSFLLMDLITCHQSRDFRKRPAGRLY